MPAKVNGLAGRMLTVARVAHAICQPTKELALETLHGHAGRTRTVGSQALAICPIWVFVMETRIGDAGRIPIADSPHLAS